MGDEATKGTKAEFLVRLAHLVVSSCLLSIEEDDVVNLDAFRIRESRLVSARFAAVHSHWVFEPSALTRSPISRIPLSATASSFVV